MSENKPSTGNSIDDSNTFIFCHNQPCNIYDPYSKKKKKQKCQKSIVPLGKMGMTIISSALLIDNEVNVVYLAIDTIIFSKFHAAIGNLVVSGNDVNKQ